MPRSSGPGHRRAHRQRGRPPPMPAAISASSTRSRPTRRHTYSRAPSAQEPDPELTTWHTNRLAPVRRRTGANLSCIASQSRPRWNPRDRPEIACWFHLGLL